eukprot:TRINITY_DN3648_c0_g1_i2.p1 TRINITY_DN3648_c0_g1~~TRINITY_DN3648_c0_g1_i2.p1  ORF type:complete len:277 (-),score=27.37 TRINITY_DN3648_c0_g1_i2:190-1020(-)
MFFSRFFGHVYRTSFTIRRKPRFWVTLGLATSLSVLANYTQMNAEDEDNWARSMTKVTHFSIDTIKDQSHLFKEKYPEGMSIVDFAFELDLQDAMTASMLFHAIDTDHDGKINVQEWLVYVSLLSTGSPHEQLDFQFKVYDTNEDGEITFDELVNIVKLQLKTGNIPMSALLKHKSLWSYGRRTPEDLARDLMKLCDVDHDNKISREEFNHLQKVLVALVHQSEHRPSITTPTVFEDISVYKRPVLTKISTSTTDLSLSQSGRPLAHSALRNSMRS